MNRPTRGALHHFEIWVPDLDRALASLGWLLETLRYAVCQSWETGRSWLLAPTYVVLEQSPALTADRNDRRRPGLNHLAFHVEDDDAVEKLVIEATQHGWSLMFPDLRPYAGGCHVSVMEKALPSGSRKANIGGTPGH
ncbi:VOC family protein [Streptomyces sp. GS7]|uniref:VOC family protein n=1 Tax=Streptomyces sp. GS7 TaxID=2692234 RepID=UPI001317BD68|nr:VOC family protein [Streptomyces sp. GS7]QHC23260.1 glyoxalase [Streptomyces sp. GS7]